MKSELRPEAPVYIPVLKNEAQSPGSPSKEPQCSRYSRRSVRLLNSVLNSPRPILGTKPPFPRAIVGRKKEENGKKDEAEEFIGKEFRSLTRNLQRMKMKEDNSTPKKKDTCCL
ncbi:unnamed protein product [Brassicogethes aeneus]|uniref:Uncharacterized protein n=1 Tax=Brassicogethes aeneus TaxID=1431903 RepID=A0A9P0B1H3_BRAAE|nr:unnamed protein product [Brassicogethes aeneus]